MNADMPHAYHPAPQLKRRDYLCLNGRWDFCQSTKAQPGEYNEKIIVPFPPESPASGIERSVLPEHYLHYRKKRRALYLSQRKEMEDKLQEVNEQKEQEEKE